MNITEMRGDGKMKYAHFPTSNCILVIQLYTGYTEVAG